MRTAKSNTNGVCVQRTKGLPPNRVSPKLAILKGRPFTDAVDLPSCLWTYSTAFARFSGGSQRLHIGSSQLYFIVKRIVLAHQGTVRVESEREEGAVFTVELPLHPSKFSLLIPHGPPATGS